MKLKTEVSYVTVGVKVITGIGSISLLMIGLLADREVGSEE